MKVDKNSFAVLMTRLLILLLFCAKLYVFTCLGKRVIGLNVHLSFASNLVIRLQNLGHFKPCSGVQHKKASLRLGTCTYILFIICNTLLLCCSQVDGGL